MYCQFNEMRDKKTFFVIQFLLYGQGQVFREIDVKKIVLFLLGIIFCFGCAKLEHMDQLLTLKAVSDEQERLGKYIEKQYKRFEMLLNAVKADTLKKDTKKKVILKKFGEPISVDEITQNDQKLELWLYRYSTEFFGSEKVYLYFEENGLLKWEYVPVEKKNHQEDASS